MHKASDSPDFVSAIPPRWLSQGLTDETGDGRWVGLGRSFSRVIDIPPAFFLTAWKFWGFRIRTSQQDLKTPNCTFVCSVLAYFRPFPAPSQHFCWISTPLLIHFDTSRTIDSVFSLSDHSSPTAGFLSSRIKPLQSSPPLPNHTESSSSPAQLVELACPSATGPFLVYGILGPQFRVTNSRPPQPSLLHAFSQAASRRSRSAVNRVNG